MEIDLKTVQSFLKSMGYSWHNEYYNAKRRHISTAVDFKDIKSYNAPTTLKLQITDNKCYVDAFITEKTFVLYKEVLDEKTKKYSLIPADDLSSEWQAYLQNQTSNEQTI